jgi:NhaP-type Na+/H+ or K+/H+ antiporter
LNTDSLILAVAAPAYNNVMALNQGSSPTFEYVIPTFLIMIFAAALFSSKTKIPHTMILLGFGVCISIISLKDIPNFNQFNINPNLVITFIIPPVIFEAMINVDYKQFKAIRISAVLLATIGVILSTLVGGFLLVYIAGLPILPAFAFAALISPTDAAIVTEASTISVMGFLSSQLSRFRFPTDGLTFKILLLICVK